MNSFSTKPRLALLGLLLALPLALHAAPPMDGPEGDPDCFPRRHGRAFDAEHLPPHLQALNLSDSQRAQIGELFKTQGASLREKLEAGKKAHDELRRLSMSTDYAEDKARAIAEDGAKTMVEGVLAHARLDHQIYQLLTPAQQQQLNDWMAEKEARRQAQ